MRRRKRRALGLTVVNCFRVARELHEAGKLNTEDAEVAADQVVSVIIGENADEWKKCAGPDWDAIMKWIEEVLIPLLMLFFSFA